ncbi:hypothetical protein H696_02456 [Fonticula alba]|uniref:HECT domain-containing protein n=1 Tax=Fonticula alba TaxID=691883 RepID=A0A058ZDI4_FONAL|nr:hypothetical protein H696_02456 [Fonticula alba]KCV71512.1 hypothetical protein H696_02456 [Fonticula alba]|eukprot:XP_009494635.1 hypothetical protein H696_02456 [Fonticula alba]
MADGSTAAHDGSGIPVEGDLFPRKGILVTPNCLCCGETIMQMLGFLDTIEDLTPEQTKRFCQMIIPANPLRAAAVSLDYAASTSPGRHPLTAAFCVALRHRILMGPALANCPPACPTPANCFLARWLTRTADDLSRGYRCTPSNSRPSSVVADNLPNCLEWAATLADWALCYRLFVDAPGLLAELILRADFAQLQAACQTSTGPEDDFLDFSQLAGFPFPPPVLEADRRLVRNTRAAAAPLGAWAWPCGAGGAEPLDYSDAVPAFGLLIAPRVWATLVILLVPLEADRCPRQQVRSATLGPGNHPTSSLESPFAEIHYLRPFRPRPALGPLTGEAARHMQATALRPLQHLLGAILRRESILAEAAFARAVPRALLAAAQLRAWLPRVTRRHDDVPSIGRHGQKDQAFHVANLRDEALVALLLLAFGPEPVAVLAASLPLAAHALLHSMRNALANAQRVVLGPRSVHPQPSVFSSDLGPTLPSLSLLAGRVSIHPEPLPSGSLTAASLVVLFSEALGVLYHSRAGLGLEESQFPFADWTPRSENAPVAKSTIQQFTRTVARLFRAPEQILAAHSYAPTIELSGLIFDALSRQATGPASGHPFGMVVATPHRARVCVRSIHRALTTQLPLQRFLAAGPPAVNPEDGPISDITRLLWQVAHQALPLARAPRWASASSVLPASVVAAAWRARSWAELNAAISNNLSTVIFRFVHDKLSFTANDLENAGYTSRHFPDLPTQAPFSLPEDREIRRIPRQQSLTLAESLNLALPVRRNNLVRDTLHGLLHKRLNIQKPLRIQFITAYGSDRPAGGAKAGVGGDATEENLWYDLFTASFLFPKDQNMASLLAAHLDGLPGTGHHSGGDGGLLDGELMALFGDAPMLAALSSTSDDESSSGPLMSLFFDSDDTELLEDGSASEVEAEAEAEAEAESGALFEAGVGDVPTPAVACPFSVEDGHLPDSASTPETGADVEENAASCSATIDKPEAEADDGDAEDTDADDGDVEDTDADDGDVEDDLKEETPLVITLSSDDEASVDDGPLDDTPAASSASSDSPSGSGTDSDSDSSDSSDSSVASSNDFNFNDSGSDNELEVEAGLDLGGPLREYLNSLGRVLFRSSSRLFVEVGGADDSAIDQLGETFPWGREWGPGPFALPRTDSPLALFTGTADRGEPHSLEVIRLLNYYTLVGIWLGLAALNGATPGPGSTFGIPPLAPLLWRFISADLIGMHPESELPPSLRWARDLGHGFSPNLQPAELEAEACLVDPSLAKVFRFLRSSAAMNVSSSTPHAPVNVDVPSAGLDLESDTVAQLGLTFTRVITALKPGSGPVPNVAEDFIEAPLPTLQDIGDLDANLAALTGVVSSEGDVTSLNVEEYIVRQAAHLVGPTSAVRKAAHSIAYGISVALLPTKNHRIAPTEIPLFWAPRALARLLQPTPALTASSPGELLQARSTHFTADDILDRSILLLPLKRRHPAMRRFVRALRCLTPRELDRLVRFICAGQSSSFWGGPPSIKIGLSRVMETDSSESEPDPTFSSSDLSSTDVASDSDSSTSVEDDPDLEASSSDLEASSSAGETSQPDPTWRVGDDVMSLSSDSEGITLSDGSPRVTSDALEQGDQPGANDSGDDADSSDTEDSDNEAPDGSMGILDIAVSAAVFATELADIMLPSGAPASRSPSPLPPGEQELLAVDRPSVSSDTSTAAASASEGDIPAAMVDRHTGGPASESSVFRSDVSRLAPSLMCKCKGVYNHSELSTDEDMDEPRTDSDDERATYAQAPVRMCPHHYLPKRVLPSAHTCIRLFAVPRYRSGREALKRIRRALEEPIGFALV